MTTGKENQRPSSCSGKICHLAGHRPPRPHRHSGPVTMDDHQQPSKEASAHPDLRSSCDLRVLPQCGSALVSFLPAQTLDTIKAAEMKTWIFTEMFLLAKINTFIQ